MQLHALHLANNGLDFYLSHITLAIYLHGYGFRAARGWFTNTFSGTSQQFQSSDSHGRFCFKGLPFLFNEWQGGGIAYCSLSSSFKLESLLCYIIVGNSLVSRAICKSHISSWCLHSSVSAFLRSKHFCILRPGSFLFRLITLVLQDGCRGFSF